MEYNWLEDLTNLNKELDERILEANEDSTLIKWGKLLPELMMADILMVGQNSGMKNQNGEDTLNILMIQKDGKAIIPFFTNPERIKALVTPERNKFEILRVNTARFFKSIRGKNAVLNPFSPYTRVFTPFETKVLSAEYIDKVPPFENKQPPVTDDNTDNT